MFELIYAVTVIFIVWGYYLRVESTGKKMSYEKGFESGLFKARTDLNKNTIKLNSAEVQSGSSRVRWAEGLIAQLPKTHEGRNSWLMNYGIRGESDEIRDREGVRRGKSLSYLKEQNNG